MIPKWGTTRRGNKRPETSYFEEEWGSLPATVAAINPGDQTNVAKETNRKAKKARNGRDRVGSRGIIVSGGPRVRSNQQSDRGHPD